MARIPEAELERLKREVSLVRLIQSQGHELKKRGKDWVMCCVFHDESTPAHRVCPPAPGLHPHIHRPTSDLNLKYGFQNSSAF